MALGESDRRDAVQHCFHCSSDRAGICDVVPGVVACVDTGKHNVRRRRHERLERDFHAVRGRSADRICAFDRRRKITSHGVQFVEDRELLRHAAALSLRRDHPHIAEIGRCFRKADDTRRLYAVIVGNEYVPSIVHRLRYSFAVPFDRCFLSGFIIISSECTGYKPQKRQKPTVHWMLAPRLGHLWPKPVSASLLRISLSAFSAAAWFARNYPADNDRAGSPSVKLLARFSL